MDYVVEVVVSLVMIPLWFGGVAELFGIPVVWLRVRRTAAWRQLSVDRGKFGALAHLVRVPTVLTIAWGYACFLLGAVVWVATGKTDDHAVGIWFLAVWFVVPAIAVPFLVARLDRRQLVDELDSF